MTARHHSTSSPYTMRTLRLLGCLRRVVLLTLLLAGSAVQAAAVVAEEVVLPLGVLSQGHPQDKLSARLREALRLTGAQLADDTVLRSLDRQCKESRCLTELALRHKASILIAATVEKHESARFVRLWLFDARKLQSRDERAVSTDEQLDQLIREMAVRLLEQYRSPTVEDHVPPSAVEPDKPASDSATSDSATSDSAATDSAATDSAATDSAATDSAAGSAPRKELSRRRRGLATSFGVLSGATLILGITLTALHGTTSSEVCVYEERSVSLCNRNLLTQYIAAYSVAGAMAVGLIFTLTLP
jgi:hypothetical protein